MREGEMVGPEVPASLRAGLRVHPQALLLCGHDEQALEVGLPGPNKLKVAGRWQHHMWVEVDDRRGARQRIEWVYSFNNCSVGTIFRVHLSPGGGT